jgi:tetratricopeptide (TPR) repeat protein
MYHDKKNLDSLNRQIAAARTDQEKIRFLRQKGELLEAEGILDEAQTVYQTALTIDKADSVLRDKVENIQIKKMDAALQSAEAKAAAGDAVAADHLKQLKSEKLKFELVAWERRVKDRPSDSAAHFEYGKRLYAAAIVENAIPELQMAAIDPQYKIDSLLYLGMAFRYLKLHDIAVNQFREALESGKFTQDKELAIRYELAKTLVPIKPQMALDEYKRVMAIDGRYKDVFAAINSDGRRTFDGLSTSLQSTQVVPALESPHEKSRNVVWCASFQAAWKALASEVAGEDISLEGSPAAADLLNRSADPRLQLPEGTLYTAAGWINEGVVERIREELKRAFPLKPPPDFPGAANDSFAVYSYIEAGIHFPCPYVQNQKPLEFTDSTGRKTTVTSFGLPPDATDTGGEIRTQPRVLFRKGGFKSGDLEFAIDLGGLYTLSQIVVARIAPEPTLSSALGRVEREQIEYRERNTALSSEDPGALGANDLLLVPDFCWQIVHNFSEVEGRRFANPRLKGSRLDVARQDILFRLDRRGAELKSEATMYELSCSYEYILDRPFLVFMKKRDAPVPYFAMWVDNAELLTRFVSA